MFFSFLLLRQLNLSSVFLIVLVRIIVSAGASLNEAPPKLRQLALNFLATFFTTNKALSGPFLHPCPLSPPVGGSGWFVLALIIVLCHD